MKPHVLFLLPLLVGCPAHEPTPPRPVVAGAPVAGAAEGTIDLPVGTPLGGFSSRAMYLGADSKKDNRDSAYSTGFVESTGIQTRPAIKVVWLENGDAPVVLIRLDLIYTFDELVSEVARQLGERTGMDLSGSVVITTSHSHNTYGPFSDQFHFYLGGDRYNEEIFQRLALQVTDVAEAAFDARQPAAIGTAWAKDWDPQDRVYRDRRGENDDLAVWDDVEPGMDKDPWLNVLRIDSVAGDPIAMLYTFGIHGTTMGADSSMVSIDSPGHLDLIVQESMPEGTVVMHMQGGAGDASPAGSDSGYARMETVGEEAKGSILDLWENTPTSSEPLTIESASRHLWQGHDQIRVQRDG